MNTIFHRATAAILCLAMGAALAAHAAHYDVVCRGGSHNVEKKIMWRSKAAYRESVKAKCPTVLVHADWTNATLACISPKYVNVGKGGRQPADPPMEIEPLADVLKVFPKKTKLIVSISGMSTDTSDTACADAFDAIVKTLKIDPKKIAVVSWSADALVPFHDRHPEYALGLIGILGMDDEARAERVYETAKKIEAKYAIFDWVIVEDCVREAYVGKYRDELKAEIGMYAIYGANDTFKAGLEKLRPKTIYASHPKRFCEVAKEWCRGDSFSVK